MLSLRRVVAAAARQKSPVSKWFHAGTGAAMSAGAGGDEYLRVLSERTMIRGFEGPVERLMERVQERVRKQPGLLSFQAIQDAEEPTKVRIEAFILFPRIVRKRVVRERGYPFAHLQIAC